MQPKETHLTTAYIALICASLGWVSWGVAAIPGVIIAHSIGSAEPATAVARKAALRVGYGAIFVGLMAAIATVLTYLGIIARWKQGFAMGNRDTMAETVVVSKAAEWNEWAWRGGIFFAGLLALLLLLPLIRKGYAGYLAARIVRGNSLR